MTRGLRPVAQNSLPRVSAPEAGREAPHTPDLADVYPVTPLQGGMLYHSLAAPGSGVYVVQYTCEINGALDPVRFREVWQRTFERHPALRTAFVWEGLEEPLQAVRGRVEIPWAESDWTEIAPAIRADRLEALLRQDRALGFSLDLAPLARMSLIRTGVETWRFLWTFHHILADGWSAVTLLEQVFREYAGAPVAPTTPPPFSSFVRWLGARDMEVSRAFWERRLAGIDQPTRLSTTDDGRLSTAGGAPDRREVQLASAETAAVQEYARAHSLTLNTVAHGAWALTLSAYAGDTEVIYTTAVAGRPASLPGVESMIGLFINSVPVRVRVSPEPELSPWLQSLQRDLFEMGPHEHTSLASIAGWTGVGASHSPFESVLVFESSPLGDRSPAEGTGLELSDVRYLDQSDYAFALLVFPGPSLTLTAVYDATRFPAELVDRLLASVADTLRGFAARPSTSVGDLKPPSAEERDRLLARAGGQGDEPPPAQDVLRRFRARVEAQPNAIAMARDDESRTYADLARRVEATANRLRAEGATVGTRIAILLDRSFAALEAILAVLDVGATYVPVALAEPAKRRRFLLDDSRADFVLRRGQDELESVPDGVRVLDLDAPTIAESSTHEQVDFGGPGDLAYILFTSGSTGRPKGVAVSRDNLAYSTAARDLVYDKSPAAFLLLSPLTFDSSIVGVFWTLSTGGTVVLPREGQEREPTILADLIETHRVTHTLCVPALWSLILEQAGGRDLGSLETVIVAGEACPTDLVRHHFARLPKTDLYNEYGPTESTVWATAYRMTASVETAAVPIGRPIPGTRVYLLDADGRLSPDGAKGEICVSGPGVAHGYVNVPEVTATKFLPDPHVPYAERRMYRTGDIGRWSPDGELLFLGRRDEQVKVRGRRIELGEVEAVLLAHPAIREVALTAQEELVAFVVATSPTERSTQELRTELLTELPSHMIPSRFVWLEELPRGRNGKLDRHRLLVPEPAAGLGTAGATLTATEEALASVWRDVLGRDEVGIDDHFFECGGHSLLAIRLLGEIRGAFGVDFPFDEFFSLPTIAASAARIDALVAEAEARRPADELAMEEFEF